ncbi:MAG: winged helix-turn-helix domain-containing protein [Dokdonella sp.]|nr:winged helix-turn-helix domain-containing protein [Dokdonella sp.]
MTRRLRFGSHLIDLATRELSEDGRLRPLSPRVFDCLAYLIEHRDRAIGRDELMAAVWGKADVADTQLAQVMLKARRAVGDSGETQQAIRTVAGFGYRWIAEVVPCEEPAEPVPAEPVPAAAPAADADAAPLADPAVAAAAPTRPAPSAPARDPGRRVALAVAVLVLVGIALAALWLRHRSAATPAPAVPARSGAPAGPVQPDDLIAVLPASVDAPAEWTWLRLGVMEFVAGRLRQAGQRVAPSENVVSMLRHDAAAGELSERVERALSPRWQIAARLRRADAGWTVDLDLRERGGAVRSFPARADEPMAAARIAADLLAAALGAAAPADAAPGPGPAEEERLSRIDAALLIDDLENAQRLITTAPAAMRATPELRLREAEIDFVAGRNEEAGQVLTRLLDDLPAETYPLLRARIVSGLGAVHVRLGEIAQAEQDTSTALALLEGRGDPILIGKTHMRRGVARSLLERYDDALADFAQARIAMQLAGDSLGLAQVELNEGALNGMRNHPDAALTSFERAADQLERFGVPNELATALTNQVVAHRALLQPRAALAASERGMALLAGPLTIDTAHLIQLRRAQALLDVGRWREADGLLGELARAIDPVREPGSAPLVAIERARLALTRDQAEQALALVAPVLDEALGPELENAQAEAWTIALRAQRRLGRIGEATAGIERFGAWAEPSTNSSVRIRLALAQAEQAFAEGRVAAADALYAQALSDANRQNVPLDLAEVAIAYADSLIARDELRRAVPIAGQLDRFATEDFDCALLQARLYLALGQAQAGRTALDRARLLAGERPLPIATADAAP